MKKVILIGTSHPIQEGKILKRKFKKYLKRLCSQYNINVLGEETKVEGITVGYSLSKGLNLDYIIIDPHPDKYNELNIKSINQVQYEILFKYNINPYPEKIEDLDEKIYIEYLQQLKIEHMEPREQYWLQIIKNHNKYPMLVTCGSDHFESFSRLIEANDIEVMKIKNKWGIK